MPPLLSSNGLIAVSPYIPSFFLTHPLSCSVVAHPSLRPLPPVSSARFFFFPWRLPRLLPAVCIAVHARVGGPVCSSALCGVCVEDERKLQLPSLATVNGGYPNPNPPKFEPAYMRNRTNVLPPKDLTFAGARQKTATGNVRTPLAPSPPCIEHFLLQPSTLCPVIFSLALPLACLLTRFIPADLPPQSTPPLLSLLFPPLLFSSRLPRCQGFLMTHPCDLRITQRRIRCEEVGPARAHACTHVDRGAKVPSRGTREVPTSCGTSLSCSARTGSICASSACGAGAQLTACGDSQEVSQTRRPVDTGSGQRRVCPGGRALLRAWDSKQQSISNLLVCSRLVSSLRTPVSARRSITALLATYARPVIESCGPLPCAEEQCLPRLMDLLFRWRSCCPSAEESFRWALPCRMPPKDFWETSTS